jgi:hypothetical protein
MVEVKFVILGLLVELVFSEILKLTDCPWVFPVFFGV